MWQFDSISITNFGTIKDQSFEFQNGRCKMIVGENLEKNSGQKSNGAGKSTLLEAIAFVLTGESLRGVPNGDIINNDEVECTVNTVLINTRTKDELTIFRKISRKASEKLVIELNGVDLKDRFVRPADGNKLIFQLIGITKEDLLNYYLISTKNYVSFLKSGDTAKKELINRFSKADVLDKLKDIFEQQLEEKDNDYNECEKERFALESQIMLLNRQILDAKNSNFEEERQQEIERINEHIIGVSENIIKYGKKKDESYGLINKYTEERDALSTVEIEASIKGVNAKISALKKIVSDAHVLYQKVPSNYAVVVQEIDFDEKKNKEQINALNAEISNCEKLVAAIKNKMHAYIECPKCSHQFSLAEPGTKLEQLQADLEEEERILNIRKTEKVLFEGNVKGYVERRENVQKDINKDREQLQKTIDETNKDIMQHNNSLVALNRELNEIQTKINNLNNLIEGGRIVIKQQDQLILGSEKLMKSLLEDIEVQKARTHEGNIPLLESQVKDLTEAMEVYVAAKEQVEQEKQQIVKWQLHFKSFKSYLANKSIAAINIYINDFLEKIGSNLSILISGYKMNKDKSLSEKISIEVFRNMKSEGNFSKFSNGEKGRIDICSIITLQNLINLASPSGGLNFLGCDEILDAMDSFGLELLRKSLQTLNRTIFIITQVDVNAQTEDIIIARKLNGETKLIEK